MWTLRYADTDRDDTLWITFAPNFHSFTNLNVEVELCFDPIILARFARMYVWVSIILMDVGKNNWELETLGIEEIERRILEEIRRTIRFSIEQLNLKLIPIYFVLHPSKSGT